MQSWTMDHHLLLQFKLTGSLLKPVLGGKSQNRLGFAAVMSEKTHVSKAYHNRCTSHSKAGWQGVLFREGTWAAGGFTWTHASSTTIGRKRKQQIMPSCDTWHLCSHFTGQTQIMWPKFTLTSWAMRGAFSSHQQKEG